MNKCSGCQWIALKVPRRLPVFSYPRSFGTQTIRTQTQMIRTGATGCFVPILFAVEIPFHQPKQRLTVSLIFSGGTLNSAEKKSHRSSYTLRRQLLENLQTQCHIFDKEVFCKSCILCGDYQETQDSRKISKHIKRERMRVI